MANRVIIFDTGPIISLTTNNLLWVLEDLKAHYGGEFYITKGVFTELVQKPLSTKKYKFEALQVLPYITRGIIKIAENEIIEKNSIKLMDAANSCYKANGEHIKIVHKADMEVVAAALYLGAETVVFDERTTRKLIEQPSVVVERLRNKLHTEVIVDNEKLIEIKKELSSLKVIRSVELITVAYELGILNKYMLEEEKKLVPNLKKAVLEGALWGLKLNGCAVRTDEIEKILKIER